VSNEETYRLIEVVVIPLAGWIAKSWISSAKTALHAIITENTNRIREEILEHIDRKFEDHEHAAFQRLTNLEDMVKVKLRLRDDKEHDTRRYS